MTNKRRQIDNKLYNLYRRLTIPKGSRSSVDQTKTDAAADAAAAAAADGAVLLPTDAGIG